MYIYSSLRLSSSFLNRFLLIASFLIACFQSIGQTSSLKIDLQTNLEQGHQHIEQVLANTPGVWVYLSYTDLNTLKRHYKILSKPADSVALVFLTQAPDPDRWHNAGIKAWAFMPPAHKLHQLFIENLPESSQMQQILVSTFPMSQADMEILVNKFDGRLAPRQSWRKYNIWDVSIPADKIIDLAACPELKYLQPAGEDQILNQASIGYTGTSLAHRSAGIGGYGLDGAGITLGIGDNAHAIHIDYIDRIRSFSPAASVLHGTHVTGTAAGNGIMDERFKGFAPQASIVEDFFSQIIANADIYYNDFDMRVTNNSYGRILGDCISAGTYDLYSFFLDQQSQDLPQLLNVFAAANDGNMTCSPFPTGYGTVTGSYSTAKNVLTVANIGKTRDLENPGSSKGPVKDGRLKPEITATGTRIFSTIGRKDYNFHSGTSMASPNVAGAATLLYQRYKQIHGNQLPGSALIKNVLMNGADDIDLPGPDFKYGFGLMNLTQSLRIIDSNRIFINQLQTYQEQTYTIQVPPQTAKLKVLLYWNDPPANPLSVNALVNDLDLSVNTAGGSTQLPLVPDPDPSAVLQPATPGIDRLNNVEQVVLENPAAGSYVLKVKGYDIPEGPQEYVVSFDLIPNALSLQYPLGEEVLLAGDSVFIYWHTPKLNSPFNIEFSDDNGNSWQTIANQIPSGKRAFKWFTPSGIASGACRIKIQSGNESVISRPFTISERPAIHLDASIQCPGSIRFSWTPVSGASAYKVFIKQDAKMQEIGSTSGATSYFISGLDQDSTYWFGVAPVINGATGIRSTAISYRPNQGNCSGITQHGDLTVNAILLPSGGRQYTSTAFSANQPFQVKVQNLDNQNNNQFRLAYRLNSGSWQQQDFNQAISPGGNVTLSLPALNLASTGEYELQVAVQNLTTTDPVHSNDTLVFTFRHIPNPPLNLLNAYTDSFESMQELELTGKSLIGLQQGDPWDFEATGTNGRLRSFVNSGITLSGNRSLSLDNAINQVQDIAASSQNYLTGTFNLGNYHAQHMELRCSFDYLLHGAPKFDSGNQVWVRGADNEAWIPLLHYVIDTISPGTIQHSGARSLSDALSAAGQQFSTSTQIRFGQRDTSLIAAPYYGNGLTLDDFSLFVVHNDVMLISVDSLYRMNCNLSDSVPLQITLANGVHNTIYDVNLFYQLDSQVVVSEQLDSIEAKDTIIYSFSQAMDLSAEGEHQLSVWVFQAADSYRLNDSIMDIAIRNQPLVREFPYLENFESGDGGFFAEGLNSSWAYGTPASERIHYAASGTQAWKTNPEGRYNDMELSFLYSPCFEIADLNKPMLSFSMAVDLENPEEGTIYDKAYIEYTTNGNQWSRLIANADATNWYAADTPVWTGDHAAYWQVYTTPLPKENVIAFRFVLQSDQGASFDGIAIDDIHIYDLEYPIFEGHSQSPINQSLGVGQEKDFIQNGKILSRIFSGTNNLGSTDVQSYRHENFTNSDSSQYFIPRSFLIQPENTPTDSLGYRLYIPDTDVKRLREDENCASCTRAKDVYRMGISTFSSAGNPLLENGNFEDSKDGQWQYIPYRQIRYVPYDKGYYAVFKSKATGEFWFNDGGPNGDLSLDKRIFTFTASHFGPRMALLEWNNTIDPQVQEYYIQRADSFYGYHTVASTPSLQDSTTYYQWLDTPRLYRSSAYYRIAYLHQNGETYYSPVRILNWETTPGSLWISPNPVQAGNELLLEWFKGSNTPLHWQFSELSGKRIQSGNIEAGFQGQTRFPIYRWGCRPGIYVLHIRSGTETWSFKVVVL